MLYLDASALMKRYYEEKGSRAVSARFEAGEPIFTSVLSYGEVHAAMGRKFRSDEANVQGLQRRREAFTNDWLFGLSKVDLNVNTMSALPRLVEEYDLRAGDAIHLSAAFWLKDTVRLRQGSAPSDEIVEFGVADRRLSKIAALCGLRVFNPEDSS
jgi:predicted nucleic acid-binding protein